MSAHPAARVTLSKAADRRRARGWRNAFESARILPVVAVLAVVLLGMALGHAANSARVGAVSRAMARGEIRNLHSVRTRAQIEPALASALEHAGDRRFAAERILAEVGGAGERVLPHVGALASLRVPAAPLAARRDLEVYRARALQALAAPRGRSARDEGATIALFTPDQIRQLKPGFVVRTPGQFQLSFLLHVALFVVACGVMHVGAHARGRRGDRLLLPAAQLLAGIGFIALAGLRDPLRDQLLFARFAQGMALAAIAFVAASGVAFERSGLRRLSLVPLLGALALSAALVLFGQGPSGSDAKVNLFGIQPIEVIRLLLVLFLAGWFAERWQLLRELHEPALAGPGWLRRFRLPRREHAVPVAAGVAAAVAFFFLQRDLGPALVLLALFLCLYAVSRDAAAFSVAGLGAIAAAFAVAHWIRFPATVGLRTSMWVSPWENGLLRADQLAHSLWGFAAGGLTGTGPALGMPALIPAAHTDLILAAVGEELGFLGLLACYALFALLVARGIAIARRAPDSYTFFLALGLTLGMALQTLLIAGGVLGLLPLSGVGTPFVSYGRSALILNFAGLGILWSISASASAREPETSPARRPRPSALRSVGAASASAPPDASPGQPLEAAFGGPLRALSLVLAAIAAAVVIRTATVQLAGADETLGRGQLARQADGELRYQYNPRLLEMAATLPRGDVVDRNGTVLATSRWSELESRREEFRQLGIPLDLACRKSDPRHYPFGGVTYHLLGDWVSRRDWGASNTAFLERSEDDRLSGYDDHARAVTIRDPRNGEERRVVRRDLGELVPLWRHRFEPRHPEVVALRTRPRDLRLSLDVRLQLRLARLLRERLREAGLERGAAVVLDAASGEALAAVSWPAPQAPLRGAGPDRLPRPPGTGAEPDESPLFDRARFGLYPPGSTFKLVTAAAALERDAGLARAVFPCRALPGGRVGAVVGGRVVRDDPTDEAHGSVDLRRGTVVSCNAYFAQLGRRLGWSTLASMAERFGISAGQPPADRRAAHVIEASYGQAAVVASPYRMARVAASFAGGGQLPGARWILAPSDAEAAVPVMSAATAGLVASYMREVVERGTAARLAGVTPAIAGKTGTAQVEDEPSHSWFVGYAPHGSASRRIAFAVLIENGGYGGVRAAQVAGDLVGAARDLGLAGEAR